MSLVKCPECGRENVSDSAKACPSCGFQVAEYYQKQNNSIEKTDTLVGNRVTINSLLEKNKKLIIIIGVGILVIWVIYFSTTRCEHDGCYNKKLSDGTLCSYHKAKLDSALSYYSNNYNVDTKNKYDLKISNISVYTNSVSTYCKGLITNDGDDTFEFVQVKASFKDSSGSVIETGDSYAVGSEGLAPGESTSFKIYCDKNNLVESCDVSVYDYD